MNVAIDNTITSPYRYGVVVVLEFYDDVGLGILVLAAIHRGVVVARISRWVRTFRCARWRGGCGEQHRGQAKDCCELQAADAGESEATRLDNADVPS